METGTLVKLKCGGPVMVVTPLRPPNSGAAPTNVVACHWITENGNCAHMEFSAAELVRVEGEDE